MEKTGVRRSPISRVATEQAAGGKPCGRRKGWAAWRPGGGRSGKFAARWAELLDPGGRGWHGFGVTSQVAASSFGGGDFDGLKRPPVPQVSPTPAGATRHSQGERSAGESSAA